MKVTVAYDTRKVWLMTLSNRYATGVTIIQFRKKFCKRW